MNPHLYLPRRAIKFFSHLIFWSLKYEFFEALGWNFIALLGVSLLKTLTIRSSIWHKKDVAKECSFFIIIIIIIIERSLVYLVENFKALYFKLENDCYWFCFLTDAPN